METLEIYKKYYSKIPKTAFTKICQGDPTSHFDGKKLLKVGRYVKWLTKLYLNNNLLLEDLTKAKDYLTILYGTRNHIKGIDIFEFDSLTDGKNPLYNLIVKYDKPTDLNDETNLITNQYFIVNKEVEIIYDDDKWFIISPKTVEASAFYASNSQWCTRYPDQFKSYTGRGKLYIFIDKTELVKDIKNSKNLNKDRRYQYHIEDNQFMDIRDNSINNSIDNPILKIAYEALIKKQMMKTYNIDFTFDEFYNIRYGRLSELDFKKHFRFILKFRNNKFIDCLEESSKIENLTTISEIINYLDISEIDPDYIKIYSEILNNRIRKFTYDRLDEMYYSNELVKYDDGLCDHIIKSYYIENINLDNSYDLFGIILLSLILENDTLFNKLVQNVEENDKFSILKELILPSFKLVRDKGKGKDILIEDIFSSFKFSMFGMSMFGMSMGGGSMNMRNMDSKHMKNVMCHNYSKLLMTYSHNVMINLRRNGYED